MIFDVIFIKNKIIKCMFIFFIKKIVVNGVFFYELLY